MLFRSFHELDTLFQQIIDLHLDPESTKPKHEDIIDVLLRIEREQVESGDVAWFTKHKIKVVILVSCQSFINPAIFIYLFLYFTYLIKLAHVHLLTYYYICLSRYITSHKSLLHCTNLSISSHSLTHYAYMIPT